MLKIDANIIWVIVNLILFFILIRLFLFKPILNIIEKRKQMIDDQFEKAAKEKDKALELQSQYEAALQGAKDESVKIIEDARERGEAEYKSILDEAEAAARAVKANADRGIEIERERALQNIKTEISALAMEAATKIVESNTSAETDSQMYDAFLKKVGQE